MEVLSPKISAQSGPKIRQLDEAAINRIAAGEVVERPASAVKELVENALDAEASRILIEVANGGKSLIRVTDNGHGMEADALPMALTRHATSKIDGSDLMNIHSFGFRGEALPSLGAVGRLTITSRAGDEAHVIAVSGGQSDGVKPAALNRGTSVELRDLFFATPARLKFLRSDRAEMQALTDVVKRLAMAEPAVGFTLKDLTNGERVVFRVAAQSGDLFDAMRSRLAGILGRDFVENALNVDAEREGVRLTGLAALPTYSRGSAVAQFLFVNGRPVRDKLLIGALRAAYMDVLSRDRHPAAALFIECPTDRVDVNVHPAKSEVRFREPALVRGLIVSALRHALAGAGHRASTSVADGVVSAMRPAYQMPLGEPQPAPNTPRRYQMDHRSRPLGPASGGPTPIWNMPSGRVDDAPEAQGVSGLPPAEGPLGAARAQVHENYIIAQTETGIVIVDQHAAHERLVYERLKAQIAETGVARQALLIPEIVSLGADADRLLEHQDALEQFGLVIEPFGPGTIALRETPALLGEINGEALLRDILDELNDLGDSQKLQSRVEAVLSRVACHGSIRSGRRMQADEMNALLRQMEETPLSGQCNHGRPTYVELKLSDIERLFGRT